MGAPFRLFLARSGLQLALLNAVRRALDQGDAGVMGEAVEEGGNAGRIEKTVF